MVKIKKPLALSLIIPAYNEEEHLSACLDTIAAQTVKPDEVIVVDNNSKDATTQIARMYPFVTLITEKKQGVVYARNKGFNAAKSDIIARIDADSRLPNDWVETILKFFADSDTEVVFTGGGHFYNVPLPRVSSWVLDQMAFRLNRFMMGHYILFGSNMAIPRSVWQKVKQDVCLRNDIHEDLDLAIHVHRRAIPIAYKANIQVGVKMRRAFNDYGQLWGNMMMWPKTLRVHGFRRWIFSWFGGVLLYALTPIILWPLKLGQKIHFLIADR